MRVLAGGALLLLALAGCGRSGGSPDRESSRAAAVPVHVSAARSRVVDRSVDLVGTLLPAGQASLAAEVEGQVKQVLVDLGDRVRAGQVLARLDDSLLLASLRETEAKFQSARADEERARPLLAQGIVSPQEYGRLKAARDAARASRDLLATRVARAEIRAPMAGAVSARRVDVGDYARVGSPLFDLVDDRVLRLRGEVSERFVPELAAGLEVRGHVDALPGVDVAGRLTRLNAALDPKSRSLTVEAEIDNADGRLRPGFFVRGAILTERGVGTVSIPSSAVVTLAGVSHVFVFADGAARERQVRIGQRFEDEIEILSGVQAGEAVIVSGLSRLRDGDAVLRVAETAEAPPR